MINSIELRGFKSFVSDIIYLNKLTILTGLNSSGKSSIIQTIRILENVANKEKEILLEGHGTEVELQNSYVTDGFILDADVNGKIVSYSAGNSISKSIENINYPKVIYISADRFGPRTSIPVSNGKEIEAKGDNLIHCILERRDDILPIELRHSDSEGETVLFNLQAWLGVISPNVKFQPYLDRKSDSSYTTFNNYRSTNVGFGLSYALPIIAALLIGSITPNSIVILENPEAHLHPRGQTEMARLISLCVQSGTQVLVETHSDHLFDGVRLFAKKNKDFATMVNTYWFELDKNNNSIVESAKLDNEGRLDNWPGGMFDQFEINASELI